MANLFLKIISIARCNRKMEEYRGSRKGRRFSGHSSIEPTSTGLLIHGSTGSLLLSSSFSLFVAPSSPLLILLFFFFLCCCCGSVVSSFVLFEIPMLVLGAARCQIPSAAAAAAAYLVGRTFKGGKRASTRALKTERRGF